MSDPFLGEIRMFAGNYPPQGWAMCDGQLMSISQNEALFSLIGNAYGGDGQMTFALPDLRGRIPVHVGTNAGTGTSYSLAQKDGAEVVTLMQQHLPAHTHQAVAQSANGSQAGAADNVWAASELGQYTAALPTASLAADALAPSGGGQPHDNVMPSVVATYIIALDGIWPSRT